MNSLTLERTNENMTPNFNVLTLTLDAAATNLEEAIEQLHAAQWSEKTTPSLKTQIEAYINRLDTIQTEILILAAPEENPIPWRRK